MRAYLAVLAVLFLVPVGCGQVLADGTVTFSTSNHTPLSGGSFSVGQSVLISHATTASISNCYPPPFVYRFYDDVWDYRVSDGYEPAERFGRAEFEVGPFPGSYSNGVWVTYQTVAADAGYHLAKHKLLKRVDGQYDYRETSYSVQ